MPDKTFTSYLSTIKFHKEYWNSWYAKYIVQIRLVLLLIISIIVMGIYGYTTIPKRLNPEINIAIVTVNVVLPGASAQDVEQLITIPLEDEIKNVKDIDTMTSNSAENAASIVIQFKSGTNGDKARDDVKSAVDTVTTLPTDATTPVVSKLDFEDEPIWTFAVTTNHDTASLMRFSQVLKTKLEEVSKVDRVTLSGYDNQQVEVAIDPEKLQSYGISPLEISQAIQKDAHAYPSGTVETGSLVYSLSIDKSITAVSDIRDTRFFINGQVIRLGDIASVGLISKTDQNTAYLTSYNSNAKQAVQFFVFRSKSANIDAAEKDAHALVDKTLAQYHGDFVVTTITNNAEEITKQFSELSKEFATTILLVFLLLLLFLGLRQAIISSITIPLTLLASFAIINALGLSLNFLTTFSFLIALGVLIDDAIVVVAAMTRYYATKRFTPQETGILVWKDFIIPLVSTAITTIWAFVPLLLASGIIGEFIKTIPIVVTVTMLASTVIALLITLPLMIVFLKPVFPKRVQVLLRGIGLLIPFAFFLAIIPKDAFTPLLVLIFILFLFVTYKIRTKLKECIASLGGENPYFKKAPHTLQRIINHGLLDIEVLSRGYMRLIDRVLVSKHGKRNTMLAIAAFTLIGYLLVPLGLVKSEFFPKQDSPILYLSGELPSGTNLTTNKQELLKILEKVKDTNGASYIVGETGAGFSAGGGRTGAANGFLLTFHLIDDEKRSISSSDIAQNLRDLVANYPNAKISVQELSGGPPAGADIQIKILGDNLDTLDEYANTVMAYLEKQPGITNVDKSIKPGTSKLVFVLDKEKLMENNFTLDQVNLWLRTFASGFKLDSIKFGNEKDKQDVIFRLTTYTQTPEDIGRLSITIPPSGLNGKPTIVPLLSLGKLEIATNPTVITREKDKRTISVSAGVATGYNAAEMNQKLQTFVNTSVHLPNGYSWETGGVNEENEKSVQSILVAMILSMLLILVTMVLEFRSFRQTFIALLFIPLSISGVFYVFALTQTPLSFPALIGILALFGIVVRHAIVVIEKINDNLRHNMPLKDALVDAAGNRLEPVLLTSLAAIVGLVPITISDPLWRGLGGAIIAGLLFSGAIKLFFVPIAYYLFYKNSFPVDKKI